MGACVVGYRRSLARRGTLASSHACVHAVVSLTFSHSDLSLDLLSHPDERLCEEWLAEIGLGPILTHLLEMRSLRESIISLTGGDSESRIEAIRGGTFQIETTQGKCTLRESIERARTVSLIVLDRCITYLSQFADQQGWIIPRKGGQDFHWIERHIKTGFLNSVLPTNIPRRERTLARILLPLSAPRPR